MSIYFSGVRSRSAGVISAIAKHLRKLTLKPVKKIEITYNPFDEAAMETRNFLFHITTPKIIATNPYCMVKPKVICDNTPPTVKFKLDSGENVVMKCKHLTALNILELYNKHITPLAPVEPIDPVVQAALDKKKKSKKGRRVKIKPGSKRRGLFL